MTHKVEQLIEQSKQVLSPDLIGLQKRFPNATIIPTQDEVMVIFPRENRKTVQRSNSQ